MTIDERLDRLTERHQALAESLEVLTADVHALQARTENLVTVSENQKLSLEYLAGIAQSHEKRIDRLEGR